jgi:hypothetical protein
MAAADKPVKLASSSTRAPAGPDPVDPTATPAIHHAPRQFSVVGYMLGFLVLLVAPLFTVFKGQRDKYSLVAVAASFAAPLATAAYVLYARSGAVRIGELLPRFAHGWVVLFPLAALAACGLWVLCLVVSPPAITGGAAGMFLCALMAVLLDDLTKVYVMCCRDRRDDPAYVARGDLFIYYHSATALGLTSGEIFWAFTLTRLAVEAATSGTAADLRYSAVGVLAGCVAIFALQLLSAYHIGMAVGRSQIAGPQPDESARGVIAYAVAQSALPRAIFLFTLGYKTLVGHSLLGYAVMLAAVVLHLALTLWYQRTEVPAEYLRATGHLHFCGVGDIPVEAEGE